MSDWIAHLAVTDVLPPPPPPPRPPMLHAAHGMRHAADCSMLKPWRNAMHLCSGTLRCCQPAACQLNMFSTGRGWVAKCSSSSFSNQQD